MCAAESGALAASLQFVPPRQTRLCLPRASHHAFSGDIGGVFLSEQGHSLVLSTGGCSACRETLTLPFALPRCFHFWGHPQLPYTFPCITFPTCRGPPDPPRRSQETNQKIVEKQSPERSLNRNRQKKNKTKQKNPRPLPSALAKHIAMNNRSKAAVRSFMVS